MALDQVAVPVGGIGRDVDDLRRVAYGPRRQEEVFILALSAVGHRADAEPVGENFCTDTAGAVVDSETVLDAVKRVREDGIFEMWESLDGFDLVMVDDGELAERLIAIRLHWVRAVGARRETALVGAGD